MKGAIAGSGAVALVCCLATAALAHNPRPAKPVPQATIAPLSLPVPAPSPTPTPVPTPTPSLFAQHTVVQLTPQGSFLIGNDDKANLFHPVNSAVNVGALVRYVNSWDAGLIKLSVKRTYNNDVTDHLLQTAADVFNVHSVRSELDTFEVRREWDNPVDSIERVEAAIGTSYKHPGPTFVLTSPATDSYHTAYAAVDYYFGDIDSFGFEGQSRRFDVNVQISRGPHRTAPADPSSDTGSKYLIGISPTWSFPLGQGGRTNGYLNYTNSAHFYDGTPKPLHSDDFELGIVRQFSRNFYMELHLNTLTKQGDTSPQFVPYGFNHSNIDVLFKFWLARPPS
jgi:hypothetical protein